MKNISKKVISIVIIIVLTLSSNISAYATEKKLVIESTETFDNLISTRSNHYEGGGIYVDSKKWTTIATSTNGFNCNVHVHTASTSLDYTSIRMLGKNGNVVWSEKNAIVPLGSRDFWCGSDVYKIQAKCVSGESTVACWPA